MAHIDRPVMAALASLVILNLMLLVFLLAGVQPSPPVTTSLFGMGPFLGANLAAGVSALILLPALDARHAAHTPGTALACRVLIGLTVVLALVSFGPHKLFNPMLPLIWPALAVAWVAVLTLVVRLVPMLLRSRAVA